MHTLERLESSDLRFLVDGEPVDRGVVLPALAIEDRVGLVARRPTDGLGAGTFVLASVLSFYDRYRERDPEFFAYPDYYAIQAGDRVADYGMLDVWPDHKNVRVDPDPETVLRAVNDRGIDVLLVPAGPTADPAFDDATTESARRGLEACYLYAPDGRPADPGFEIEAPADPVEGWFRDVADTVDGRAPALRAADGGVVRQGFRRVSREDALRRLAAI